MKKIVWLIVLAAALCAFDAPACMTLVAGRKVSPTGRVIVGHNEDDAGVVWVKHALVPARDWPAGSFLPATAGCAAHVPQVAHTAAFYWSEVKTAHGDTNADAFLNEHGVFLVSDSGGFSRERMDDSALVREGGIRFNLRRAVAERAWSAREAVKIIGELVDEWGYAPSARIYTVADRDEAWMVQIVHGRNYVAVKCPDDAVSIMPNLYTVHDLRAWPHGEIICSKNLKENARAKGFWNGREPFDFARAYQGSYAFGPEKAFEHPNNTGRFRQAIRFIAGVEWPAGKDWPFSVKPKAGTFSAFDMQDLLSAHNPPSTPAKHVLESWSICSSHTVESSVCVFGETVRETEMRVAAGQGCKVGYVAFRPFGGTWPEALDDSADGAARLATHVNKLSDLKD